MNAFVPNTMRRWPDVPAAEGWLSLDARGHWRLHPHGEANEHPAQPGERITHAGLIAFINRHYACDTQRRWFFQNGPQRVYVRLDAAPYIVRLACPAFGLATHTGQTLARVHEWLLDDAGHIYLHSPLGPGRMDDRDLPVLVEQLTDSGGGTLLDALGRGATCGVLSHPQLPPAPWRQLPAHTDLPATLGFNPGPVAQDRHARAGPAQVRQQSDPARS